MLEFDGRVRDHCVGGDYPPYDWHHRDGYRRFVCGIVHWLHHARLWSPHVVCHIRMRNGGRASVHGCHMRMRKPVFAHGCRRKRSRGYRVRRQACDGKPPPRTKARGRRRAHGTAARGAHARGFTYYSNGRCAACGKQARPRLRARQLRIKCGTTAGARPGAATRSLLHVYTTDAQNVSTLPSRTFLQHHLLIDGAATSHADVSCGGGLGLGVTNHT